MNKLIVRGVALFFLLIVSQGANAIGWVGTSGTCVSGSSGTIQYSGYCDWNPVKVLITGMVRPLVC
ncbi:hypothetical protein ABM005_01645 [Morganella morganii]|uniref:hypothetical protein n=1 Tax=Morganella morganii TaxID=582 RepID=UPI003EBBD6A0